MNTADDMAFVYVVAFFVFGIPIILGILISVVFMFAALYDFIDLMWYKYKHRNDPPQELQDDFWIGPGSGLL